MSRFSSLKRFYAAQSLEDAANGDGVLVKGYDAEDAAWNYLNKGYNAEPREGDQVYVRPSDGSPDDIVRFTMRYEIRSQWVVEQEDLFDELDKPHESRESFDSRDQS